MYMLRSGIALILYSVLTTVFFPSFGFSLPQGHLQFQNIVIFGDSLSDNGNVYALTNKTYPIPPYWNGRFSDGPTWVDRLNVSNVTNYAYGSATTDNNLVEGYTKEKSVLVPGMLQQVELYLNHTDVNTIDFARTLYILWGGGNDFINDMTLYPNVIAVSLFKSVRALLDVGAKNILVFNQVPVQYFPFSQSYNAPELFIYLTDEGNFYISTFTKAMQVDNPQVSLKMFDIHSVILNIVTQNSSDLLNTVNNCWLNVNVTYVSQLCSNPKEYLFVDLLHFTSRGHELIADAVRSYLFDSYQTSSAVAFIPQIDSIDICMVFFFIQIFHFLK